MKRGFVARTHTDNKPHKLKKILFIKSIYKLKKKIQNTNTFTCSKF